MDLGICDGVVAASRDGRLSRCFGEGFDGERGDENRAAEQREEYDRGLHCCYNGLRRLLLWYHTRSVRSLLMPRRTIVEEEIIWCCDKSFVLRVWLVAIRCETSVGGLRIKLTHKMVEDGWIYNLISS